MSETVFVDPCVALRAGDVAYMKLSLGGVARVMVDMNGERLEVSTANADRLLRYLQILQPQCDSYTAVALGNPKLRPVKFFFG